MRSFVLRLILIASFAVWPVFGGCAGDSTHAEDDHAEHGEHDDHAGHEGHEDHLEEPDDHGDHGHDQPEVGPPEDMHLVEDDHEGHDHSEHGVEWVVHLSPEAVRLAGIRIEVAEPKSLERTIELPGEIGFNEDRLVHVTPRYAGVAREVHGRIGAHVKEGDLLAVLESNESLTRYNIVAPISGRIIEKHLTVGEFAAEDRDLFLIADLTTVWANCEVYAKDMQQIRQGMDITISAVGGGPSVQATLSYVAPVYNEHTRSALARAVLKNNGNLWRPGTFIRAAVPIETDGPRLAVKTEAVQTLDDRQVVFVPGEEGGEFEILPVQTGINGGDFVEIVSGLHPGDAYVSSGAFDLKAKMVTADLDAHAGHGH